MKCGCFALDTAIFIKHRAKRGQRQNQRQNEEHPYVETEAWEKTCVSVSGDNRAQLAKNQLKQMSNVI